MKDNLQHVHALRKTIKTLVAYIRAIRAWIKENDTLRQEREKELLHAISVGNRKVKKMTKQLENYREDKQLLHLQEVVKNQSEKLLKQTKIINKYEMEKL